MCKKILIIFLTALLLNVNFPRVIFSQVGEIEEEIAQHPPEMRSTPEEDIPVQTVKKGWPAWVWVGLGVLAVGAAVGIAAGAGGGGGGGGSSNTSPSSTASGSKGNVAVGW
jgi:hypothetical protein